jgi:hypothetical protein
MSMEILGLLDTLESMILDSTKVPFSKKVIVDEDKLLSLVDKIRLVLQGGVDFARKAIGRDESREAAAEAAPAEKSKEANKAVEVIEQAYQMSKEIREGADKYADEVLSNLEATSTRILRTVRAGRERLTQTTQAGSQQ